MRSREEEWVGSLLEDTKQGTAPEYEYAGLTEDGYILYRKRSGDLVKVDVKSDIATILKEGALQGVFTNSNSVESNPRGIVLRCELVHELARLSGEVYNPGTAEINADIESIYKSNKEYIDSVCGEDSYYKYSFAWFYSKAPVHVRDLYSFRDMQGAITWFELAYVLYFVVGVARSYNWVTAQVPSFLRVCYIKQVKGTAETLEDRLSEYRGKYLWMKPYLNAIQSGKKAIPVTVFWALLELQRNLSPKEDLDSTYSWVTQEVTREDLVHTVLPWVKEKRI